MKKQFLLPLAILSLVSFNSCKKDEAETEPENKKPTVSITNPTGNIYVNSNENNPITVTATASDDDGSIASVAFYLNGAKIATSDTEAPYERSVNVDVAEGVVFKVVATDNEGASTEKSITVDVILNP